MAVTFLASTTGSPYYNADGLTQKYGTKEATISKSGEIKSFSGTSMLEVNIPDLTLLSATEANPVILDAEVFLPKAAYIRRVRIYNTTAATTGSTSLLNVGTVKRDTTTEGDFNGIIDSLDSAVYNALGEGGIDIIVGGTGAGALIGTTSGTDSGGYYICASAETAVFTAGALKIQIFYDMNAT